MVNEWAPKICCNPNQLKKGGKAANIETCMWSAYRRSGFNSDWGVYLFGNEEEEPTMCHSNARPRGMFPRKYLTVAGINEYFSDDIHNGKLK